jgi:hypothetical protein
MVNAENVLAIGTSPTTDPSTKSNPDLALRQTVINLTDVMKAIALVLIDIRDGKKA